jgi:hypothetical protein
VKVLGQAETGTRKRGRKALWAAVAVIAIAAAGATGYKIAVEKSVSRLIAERGGRVGTVEADFFGRVHLRDVTLPLKEGSELRVAAIDGRPRILFLDGMFEVSGVELDMRPGKIAVPKVIVEQAEFGRDTLAQMFGAGSDLSLPKQLALLTAKSVTAPEVIITQTVAGSEQKLVYKNVVSEGIVDGRIARYSASGASFEAGIGASDGESGEKRRLTGSLGAMTGQDVDAAYLARIYTEKAGPGDGQARPVYGPFSIKDIAFSDGEASFGYDEVRSSGVSMRMLDEPLRETLEKLNSVSSPEDLPVAERQDYFARILSVADLTRKADMEMLGLKIDAPDKDGEEGERIRLAMDRLSLELDGRKLDASVNGFSMAEGADYVKVSEASISGFSWDPSVEALKKFVALQDGQHESFPFTTLLPEFGTFRVAGIDADLPDSGTGVEDWDEYNDTPDAGEGDRPQRIRFTMKGYELALAKPRNGIPTDVRAGYQDFALQIPEHTQDETLAKLRKLGFNELVLSSNLEAAWDEANETLVIKDISTSGKDIGRFSLSGLLGGVSGDFFSGDAAKAQAALFGLTAREASLQIEDKGFTAKGIQVYAEQNGMTEDQARGMLEMTASVMLQQFAAQEPRLRNVVDAVSRFIAKPGTFTLTAKSKSASGIGALEFAVASQNPLLLLDRVDFEATAE